METIETAQGEIADLRRQLREAEGMAELLRGQAEELQAQLDTANRMIDDLEKTDREDVHVVMVEGDPYVFADGKLADDFETLLLERRPQREVSLSREPIRSESWVADYFHDLDSDVE